MKFGCCTTMDYYEDLERFGYDYIELSGRVMAEKTEEQLKADAAKICGGKLKCNGFNSAIAPQIAIVGPNFNREAALEYAKRLCRAGAILGIEAIGVGSPMSRKLPDGYEERRADQEAMEFLEALAGEAKACGIQILWEALNSSEADYGLSLEHGARLLGELKLPNLWLVCDDFHMRMNGETLSDLKKVFDLVRHVHICQGNGLERRYLSEEYKDVYRELTDFLKEEGYERVVSIEAFDGPVREGACESIKILKALCG